jgi:NADH:ubiquinone oxidoreductase subunit 5 (subunit L)/multisubunit Na+/H+ antiporter MnhA subunit
VASAWHASPLLGTVLLLTALVTAYYTFRLYFRVFEGPKLVPDEPHPDHHGAHDHHGHEAGKETAPESAATTHHAAHNHEPAIMILPLVLLAVGAVAAGYFNFPAHKLGDFLGHSPSFIESFNVAATVYNHAGDAAHLVNPLALGQPEYRPERRACRAHDALRLHGHQRADCAGGDRVGVHAAFAGSSAG